VIVDEVEESKESNRVLVMIVVGAVDDRGDATDRFPVAVGDERGDFAVLL